MIIRPTTEEDWEVLREIRLASLLDAPTAFGVTYAALPPTPRRSGATALPGVAGPFVLAFMDGVAVGMAGAVVSAASEST